ncbi:TPA: hypothetical protein ACK3Q6_007500 [Burkholderia cepacia]|nr:MULTISPECIES: hypothetical protein [Burkholderia cepacia complex]CAK1332717.1 Uncharacterised protein [Burkholderia pseudomallei]HDR9769556.1 hypothetical protein [Burkholderia cepacia ATCC 25416]MCA8361292.1 hypothetical protein [Burkholderia cepacia]MCW3498751.1 hypothetical protein [Burkholderia cenocepacia]MCW3506161.1 hypothetical protein [Burkholderia cenocepacia]
MDQNTWTFFKILEDEKLSWARALTSLFIIPNWLRKPMMWGFAFGNGFLGHGPVEKLMGLFLGLLVWSVAFCSVMWIVMVFQFPLFFVAAIYRWLTGIGGEASKKLNRGIIITYTLYLFLVYIPYVLSYLCNIHVASDFFHWIKLA